MNLEISSQAMYRTVISTIVAPVAFGLLAISAVALSSQANASPLPLFPFFLAPSPQMQQAPEMQASQNDEDNVAVKRPVRFKRQIVS
jgi:hypothetical protein